MSGRSVGRTQVLRTRERTAAADPDPAPAASSESPPAASSLCSAAAAEEGPPYTPEHTHTRWLGERVRSSRRLSAPGRDYFLQVSLIRSHDRLQSGDVLILQAHVLTTAPDDFIGSDGSENRKTSQRPGRAAEVRNLPANFVVFSFASVVARMLAGAANG